MTDTYDTYDTYDAYSEVLGAYALDAVDALERGQIEDHLADCPRCRAEVAEHREVAAFLSQSGSDAPEGVWDRIVADLAPPAPPMRLHLSPVDAPSATERNESSAAVVDLASAPSARRGFEARTMVAVLAAAACIVAVLGFVSVGQSQRLNRMEAVLSERTVEGLANDVVATSQVEATLQGPAGEAQAVVARSGQGYLIMDDYPEPLEGDVYQLWGKVDDTVLSLGTFGGGTSVVPFSVDPDRVRDIELFAVTQEKAPGVVASANDPVMVGTV